MINIKNYKELIRTPNSDGTERFEIIGCKMMDNGNEIEANLVFPKVSEDGLTVLADDENKVLFTLYIPEE